MARVTVEDCVLKIPNRFDLVMLAAQRARDIASGSLLSVERDNDKNPVVALREIADETIGLEKLAESLVQGMQKHVETDEPEEDAPEFDVPSIPGVVMGTEEAVEVMAGTPDLEPPAEADAPDLEPPAEVDVPDLEALTEAVAAELGAGPDELDSKIDEPAVAEDEDPKV